MRSWIVVLGLVVGWFSIEDAFAQGGGADPATSIVRYQDYLARKPYHDWGFDKLCEAAIQINHLPKLIAEYEERVKNDPSDETSRVILARLLAKNGKVGDGLVQLKLVKQHDANYQLLLGSLLLKQNSFADALIAFDAAAKATTDAKQLREIHKQRGNAALASGDRARAVVAFKDLAELEPKSFNTRLEAARALAEHALSKEALEQLAVAEELAGDDSSKRCQVLSETGRLHERQNEADRAIEVYERALPLMARGNWLKKELEGRLIAIHKRAGTLDRLIEEAKRRGITDRQDLDSRVLAARALEEAGKREDARDELRAITKDFPDDLALSRQLLDVLSALNDTDGRIAEMQRILEKKPEELEIYIDLGRAFASAGRLEQARLQWTKTLEKRLTDAQLCARIGSLFAYHRMNEDAAGMYEKAIQLEPKEIRHYADLAALHGTTDRRDDALKVLARAEAQVAESASGQEELAQQYREFGEVVKARGLIEKALVTKADDSRLLTLLADLLALEGDRDRASEVLHHLIDVVPERAVQSMSVGTLLRLYQSTNELELLLSREEATLAKDPKSRSASLVLGKALVQRREPDRALDVFERLLAADPDSEIAREQVARLLEARGDLDQSLVRYQELIDKKPANRRQFLKEIARIHLALYDQEKAFSCYEEILKSSPDNPAAFIEVAAAYQKLGLFEKATDCLKQAVRLKPDDARNRLKLAEALRRNRENDEALEQIEAALASKEPEVVEDARKKYYALLSEIGRLDSTIAELRKRCEDNPYDSEAPIRLTDLYSRELEFELALELLDRLVRFQPKEVELRRERARILRMMERYDDAIADFEVLLTEENVDRERIQTEIAESALGKGDLERAKSALALVNDPHAVARTFTKAQLLDEAQAAVSKGLERSPRDEKLLRRLAKLKLDAGDKAGSVAIREKLVAAKGDSFKELVELGQTYHELGRKDDALTVGRKLFSMIRIEEKADDEEDDEEEGNRPAFAFAGYSYVGAGAFNQQYSERVHAIAEYFTSKGLNKEYCDIGVAEMALQPTNMTLLSSVLGELNEQKRGKESLELIDNARKRTLDKNRIPDGYTRRSLEMSFESSLKSTAMQDALTAELRLKELEHIGDTRTASQEVERIDLLSVLHRDEEALAAVNQAAKRLPDSVDLTAFEASLLLGRKSWDAAIPVIERLIALTERFPSDAEENELRDLAFARDKGQLLQSFPVQLQRRVSDADLKRLSNVSTPSIGTSISAGLGRRCTRSGAIVGLANSLSKVGRKDEAAAVLRRLVPTDDDALATLCAIGTQAFTLDLFEFAEEIFVRTRALESKLSNDPVLGFTVNWHYWPNEALKNHARILEKRGDALGAYDLLRRGGDAPSGELVLTNAKKLPDAEQRYAEELARLEADFEAATHDRKNAYRDAGVLLAGVQIQRLRFDEAILTYRRIVDHLPDEVSLLQQIADLEERAGRADATIAAHRNIIAKKRELNLRPPKVDEPPGRQVGPIAIARTNEAWVWNNLRSTNSYYGGGTAQRYSLKENHAAILKIHLERKEIGKATEVMREIARDDISTYRWLADSLGQVIGDYNLGKEGIPILRLLHGQDPTDGEGAMRLAEALVAAEKDDEAQKVLNASLTKASADDWYTERMRDLLTKIEERVGRKSGETLEDLKTRVASDPKNVKLRVKLARRLLADQKFTEALAEAVEAEKLAPHLDEGRALAISCEQALGNDAAFEARIMKEADRAKDNEAKFRYAVMLADRAYARGERDKIDAIFEKAIGHDWGGSLEYAPSSWWIEKHEFDEALKRLDAEIETMSRGNWSADQARTRRAWLVATRGQPFDGLTEPWKKLVESTSLGQSTALFGTFAGALAAIPEVGDREAEFESFIAGFEAERQALHRLAFRFAVRDLDGAERIAGEITEKSDKYAYLYPLLISLQRIRGDRAAALATLETIERKKLVSEQRTVWGGVGTLSEIDALLAEKGSLLFELGKKDEAIAIWRTIFDEQDDQGRRTLANILFAHELVPEAIETLEGYFAEKGEREYALLLVLASYHEKIGQLDQALTVLSRARVLAFSQPSSRDAVFQAERRIHRKRGTLESMRQEVEQVIAADPEDRIAQRQVLQLSLELGDRARVRVALEKLRARPEERAWIHAAIAEEALGNGDADAAIAALAEHMDSVTNEWRRRIEGTRLAQLRLKKGDVTGAIEVITKSQQNPYGIEAKLEIGRLLTEGERYEESLRFFDEALALDPKNTAALSMKSNCLAELGREVEALELTFLASELPTNLAIWGYESDNQFRKLAHQANYAPILERELAANATDPILNRRAGVIAFQQGRFDEAVPHLEIAKQARDTDALVLAMLCSAETSRGNYAAARAHATNAMQLLDRLDGLPGFENMGDYMISFFRTKLGEIELHAGDEAAASRAWRTAPSRRFRNPQPYRYAYYNTPIDDASFVPDALYSHGLDDQFVNARNEYKFLSNWDPYGNDRAVEIEFRFGSREKAIDALLRRAFDPAASFFSVPENRNFYFSGMEDSDSDASLLVQFARENDSTEAVLERVRELRKQHADPASLRAVEQSLLTGLERHDEVIALMREDLGKDEFNAALRERLGSTLIVAKRYDEAIAEFELAIRLFEASRPLGSTEERVVVMSGTQAQSNSGRPRFAFAGSNSGYGSSVTSYSTSSSSDTLGSGSAMRVRGRLVAALIKLGRRDEAQAIENKLVEIESFSRWRYQDVRTTIANHLFEIGEFAEGEKRIRAVMAEQKSQDQQDTWTINLVESARRYGSPADLQRICREAVVAYDRRIERDPADDWSILGKARLLVESLDDPQAGLKLIEGFLARRPWRSYAHLVHGDALRAVGDAERALTAYDEAARRMRCEGVRPGSTYWYGYGQVLAMNGRMDEARTWLKRALAADPKNPKAEAAKALLN